MESEQSITIARFSGRGCCNPGKNGWKLATAAMPSPSEPHREKLRIACGAFTLGMKSRSMTALACCREMTTLSADLVSSTSCEGQTNWVSRRLPKISRCDGNWLSTVSEDSGTRCGRWGDSPNLGATVVGRKTRSRSPAVVQHRIAERDGRLLTGRKVAHVHRVGPRLDHFEHHGRVARGDRILLLRFGGRLFDDDPLEYTPADFNLQVEQNSVERKGERVHGLDVRWLVVAVGPGHGHPGEEIAQDRRDGDVAPGDLFATGAGHCGCQVVHCFSSPS